MAEAENGADAFDSVLGDKSYTPLRAINLVTWQANVMAKELKSAADVQAAQKAGQVEIKRPGIAALSGHYGLMGMVERVEQMQGQIRINSTLGKGTLIEVRLSKGQQDVPA